jgi:hypothetical protein
LDFWVNIINVCGFAPTHKQAKAYFFAATGAATGALTATGAETGALTATGAATGALTATGAATGALTASAAKTDEDRITAAAAILKNDIF